MTINEMKELIGFDNLKSNHARDAIEYHLKTLHGWLYADEGAFEAECLSKELSEAIDDTVSLSYYKASTQDYMCWIESKHQLDKAKAFIVSKGYTLVETKIEGRSYTVRFTKEGSLPLNLQPYFTKDSDCKFVVDHVEKVDRPVYKFKCNDETAG